MASNYREVGIVAGLNYRESTVLYFNQNYDLAVKGLNSQLSNILELSCAVQEYHWGQKGSQSIVANLIAKNCDNFKIDENKHYAELWMGTHVNAPSLIKTTNQTLASWLTENSSALGSKVTKMFGRELPFLFKVLSVRQALSIQAHPDKLHAEALFATKPQLYRDPNHKPELAIALSPFEALCSFRPFLEIVGYLKEIPELRKVTGVTDNFCMLDVEIDPKKALRDWYKSILHCDERIVKHELDRLLERLKISDSNIQKLCHFDLISRLSDAYPGDVGCFSVYLLNYVKLVPGEALYLGANEPHAYLSGDVIECMACSDNVVRAGLTPKFKDVDTLCQMLTYNFVKKQDVLLQPLIDREYFRLFSPPVHDFAVAEIKIPVGVESFVHNLESASILLVISGRACFLSGTGLELHPGKVIFISASTDIVIGKITEPILIYLAFTNV